MSNWVRFEKGGVAGIGTLDGDSIAVHDGDMFGGTTATGETLALDAVTLLTPCAPGKFIALWNNSRAAAEKQGLEQPEYPLFFLKPSTTYLAPGGVIRKPAAYDDVTAMQLLDADPSFPQWARAKGFDTFGAFGSAIVTDTDVSASAIRAELNGRERQNYAVADLFMQPAEIVAKLSRSMTLEPGDLIACGTGPGALPMKPGATIDVIIDGVGTLSNTYEA
mgnify:CR=1 FL=1